MPQISKFQFETDFADPDADLAKSAAEDDAEIEPPMFSEAELLSARENGYEAGIAAGQTQALAGIEKQISEILANINAQMGTIDEQVAGHKALAAEDIAILAGAITTKITGVKSDESRLALLERMVTDSLERLYQVPQVTVRVPSDLANELSSRLVTSDVAITISVVADAGLTGTDCRIGWDGGGSERIEAQIWQEVEGLLEHYVAASPAATTPGDPGSDAAAPAEGDTEPAMIAETPSPEPAVGDSAGTNETTTDAGVEPAPSASPSEPQGDQPEPPAPGDLNV